ncbi:type II toxin-antitoxin system VapB family antitoxin [Candidatus Binatia bacterium]|nr:type II toxin-antitoxin system VapB family antitoxin [Candidatus Binatia bacterium]
MRTTMIIDDDLIVQAKKRAAETGVSLSEVVNRALRDSLSRRHSTESLPPFRMVTFGRGQPRVDHAPEALARVIEDEDETSLRGS